ncbi:MAG: RNA polymerase sigma factor [Candidatus Edwardsbacteria bacterium]
MNHLSSEEVLAYLDGDKSTVNLKKASKHLDKCDKCTTKLSDFASIGILLELTIAGMKEQREKEILGKCPDADTMFGLIEDRLSIDERRKIEAHLKECKYCQEELEVIRAIEKIPEVKAPEIEDPQRFLPKILRYFELYFVASEREKVITKEKEFRIPGLETVRKMLFPKQPVLVPLGFAELTRRDRRFYIELDDAELMEACKKGDNMAWTELEGRFRNYAFTIIKGFGLEEDWEDVWQECFLALAGLIQKYEERGRGRSFIRSIIVNKCRAERRKKRKEKIFTPLDDQIEQQAVDSDPLKRIIEEEEAEHLIENIKKMPEEFRTVTMALIDGSDDGEIAQSLNIPIGTVRSRKFRTRLRLIEMKSNDLEFMNKIKGLKWVKRKLYKLFTLE